MLINLKLNKMDELIIKLQEKAKSCGDKTKEDRARKGAYIDCIIELKALCKHVVIKSVCECGISHPDADRECCTICGKLIHDEDL